VPTRGAASATFAPSRGVPTPGELIERVELQRAVADEVLALGEPYRSTVLLHFVEGYSSAEISRRLGIPDGTVRRRLKTALEQLREALNKRAINRSVAGSRPWSRSRGHPVRPRLRPRWEWLP
jgi:DNA-directed RNA polymerase specialized sigma24 family protein